MSWSGVACSWSLVEAPWSRSVVVARAFKRRDMPALAGFTTSVEFCLRVHRFVCVRSALKATCSLPSCSCCSNVRVCGRSRRVFVMGFPPLCCVLFVCVCGAIERVLFRLRVARNNKASIPAPTLRLQRQRRHGHQRTHGHVAACCDCSASRSPVNMVSVGPKNAAAFNSPSSTRTPSGFRRVTSILCGTT